MSNYIKAIVAFVIGAITFVLNLLQGCHWTVEDTIALLGWIGSTLAVWGFPNVPPTTPAAPPAPPGGQQVS